MVKLFWKLENSVDLQQLKLWLLKPRCHNSYFLAFVIVHRNYSILFHFIPIVLKQYKIQQSRQSQKSHQSQPIHLVQLSSHDIKIYHQITWNYTGFETAVIFD